MNYKIAQFILTPPRHGQSVREIYVSQPDANKEALAGKIFALIEIESSRAENLKIINFLLNVLSHNYYQNEKMILRERVETVKIEHIFESALAKTNKKLAEFLQTEKIRLNPDILNITIGVVYADSLYFSSLGKNRAFLIYKNKLDAGPKYKLADITAETGEAKKPASAVKLFSSVVSGALPRGGYFIFSGEALGEYLSAKQIIDIVTTLPPSGAAEQIKNTLAKINAYVPFMGIIIKNTAGQEEAKIKEPAAVSTGASIVSLNATEEKTEKLLTPPGLVNAKKWSSIFGNFFGRIPSFSPRAGQGVFLKDKIFAKKKTFGQTLLKIFYFIKNTAAWLIGALIFIFKIITDKKALAEFYENSARSFKNYYRRIKAGGLSSLFWYKNLGKTSKILFSAFLICLIIFSGNLIRLAVKNNQAEKQAVYNDLTAALEQKQNQIDASLLYNNESGAQKLLGEIKPLLSQLPQKNQSQKDLYNRLAAKHQVQMEKISRVIKVSPVELANFLNLNVNAKPANLILASGKLYAADAAQKTVFSLDPASKIVTAANLSDQNFSRLDFPSRDKNQNLYYISNNGVKMFDLKTEKLSALALNYPGDPAQAADLKQYNGRFYLTDRASGQIYRLTKADEALAGAAAWLNGKEDFSAVASTDIDGNIYVLKTNGEILVFSKGARQNFSLSPIEPALTAADKLAVSPEKNYIYVLDAAGRRVIVYEKSGKLVCQYSSDNLTGLKDFQIDEVNKKLYFLNGAAVSAVDLTHLK